MFEQYKNYLLNKAVYEKDEDGVIIAYIPWYDAYFTQGESFEQARRYLLEVIEEVIMLKLEQQDKTVLAELKSFTSQKIEYA